MSRLATTFSCLENKKKKALITFVSANDPDFITSKQIIFNLPNYGADIIEIGLPFSDPMADGPTIQRSSLRGIKAGFNLDKTFKLLSLFRKKNNKTPLVLMGYFNTISQYGVEKFFSVAKSSGVDGLILVDLPPEEHNHLMSMEKKYNIDIIRLVTPTTDEKRLKLILKNATGFIYYVSISGITGTKKPLISRVNNAVNKMRKYTKLPIVVGFGIKYKDQIDKISKFANGVVVGSSLVSIIEDSAKNNYNTQKTLKNIEIFMKSLISNPKHIK